jgi:hypothetical protein
MLFVVIIHGSVVCDNTAVPTHAQITGQASSAAETHLEHRALSSWIS